MTIQEFMGMLPVAPIQIQKLISVKDTSPDPSLIIGLELEIENISGDQRELSVVPHITWREDNSLRNNGLEFITAPARYKELIYVINQFFHKTKFTKANYSERCSIHVHANCQDLTIEQLSAVLMLYQVFEKLLYKFIGNDRDSNIFCVPWYHTRLSYNILQELTEIGPNALKRWQKYTGLNLLPLFELGTIEFRHMHGHSDIELIKKWLNIIQCLFAYARNNSVDTIKDTLLKLNTSSAYNELAHRVFAGSAEWLLTGDYRTALEEGVINMKYSIIKGNPKDFNIHNVTIEEMLLRLDAEPGLARVGALRPSGN